MTPESPLLEYANIVWRQKWYILLPTALGLIVSAAVLTKLPRQYIAQAVIRQQVEGEPSRDYVRPVVSALMPLDPKILNDQVKGLEFLKAVDHRLGSRMPSWVVMDQRIAFLKEAFWLEVQGTALTFTAQRGDPQVAADVANAVADTFVESAGKKRAAYSEDFTSWFRKRLDESKRRLDDKDNEIGRFRDLHRGSLPEDFAANSAGVSTSRGELTRVQADIASRQQEIDTIMAHAGTTGVTAQTASGMGADPVLNLQKLQSELSQLLVTKTDKHPDVIAKQAEIETYRKQVEAFEAMETARTPDHPSGSPLSLGERLRKESLERELSTLRAREQSLSREAALYQARLAEAGRLEPSLGRLSRERDEIAREYGTALSASQSAALGNDYLEKSQPGQFTLEVQATPPLDPVSPKAANVLGIGLILGLGLGVGLVVLLELLDQTYRYPEEIQAHFEVPVIATITRIDPREARKAAAAAEERTRKAG